VLADMFFPVDSRSSYRH